MSKSPVADGAQAEARRATPLYAKLFMYAMLVRRFSPCPLVSDAQSIFVSRGSPRRRPPQVWNIIDGW
eukprot:5006227-Pyramimonas_sp.AAC.1